MDILKPTSDGITEVLNILSSGGVIAHATETCYGLACDMTNADAVTKLFAIKQRPSDQPVSALFTGVDHAKEYVEWNELADTLAADYLPGPLTIILPLKTNPPHKIFPTPTPTPTVGIRISPNPVAQELIEKFGQPISTTSANVHGQPNPYSAAEIEEQYRHHSLQPDAVIDSGALPGAESSTVVDCCGQSVKVLRGAL